MKKLLLSAFLLTGAFSANAVYWLPTPEITSETTDANGNVTITWSYDDATEPCTYFQVIVYKMHKAQEAETFRLAGTDFSYIESNGTQERSEERGATWDYLPDNPGWWVKFPKYMNQAMGIDSFQYFYGSDNADEFGGAYMISPDYDLSHLTKGELNVYANLGHEALSVSGGFCLWAFNTNWYDPNNVGYKPIRTNDFHYTDLDANTWKEVEEVTEFPTAEGVFDPDVLDEINGMQTSRSRLLFYGSGYSTYWINSFTVDADMEPGDMVDYGASLHNVTEKSFTIDTSADTASDYVYAVEVRAVRQDFDDYRNIDYIRFTNYPYSTPRHVLEAYAGVKSVTENAEKPQIVVEGRNIALKGAKTMEIYDATGTCHYEGSAATATALGTGIYIVKADNNTFKVILK